MAQPHKPLGMRWKIIGGWALVVGNLIFWIWFWVFRGERPPPEMYSASEPVPRMAQSIVFMVLGAFVVALGFGVYAIVVRTNCFTFNFDMPVWKAAKRKIYVANIFVQVILLVGTGMILAGMLNRMLERAGLSANAAYLAPMLASLFLGQLTFVWVNLWAPIERRLIEKRLAAKGISTQRIAEGMLIGLSDPTRSSLKKFTAIEDDVGMLWAENESLTYLGDSRQFNYTRLEVERMEQKADGASTSALSGTVHPILYVKESDGVERAIRLHAEAVWTLGQKRIAMNGIAERIRNWLAAGAVALG
jgi:hypothetical protein